jgi:hypothetical protein
VLLTDSLWKWVLTEKDLDVAPFQRFWNQLLAWAMPEKEEIDLREIDIWTDREQLFLGEEIVIKARKTGKEAASDIPVACEITTADERKMTFRMTPDQVVTPSGKAYPGFAVKIKGEEPGIHQLVGVMDVAGKRIESDPVSFFVKPFTPESVPRAANSAVLKLLASNSSGKYFSTLQALNDELSTLRFASTEQEQVNYRSLWELWPILGTLIGLLAISWLLRKLRNMP